MAWLRRRSMWLILIASVALNAGVGATFGVRAYQNVSHPGDHGGGPPRCNLGEELGLTAEQEKPVAAARVRMREGVGESRQGVKAAHDALTELMAESDPDREAIYELIGQISRLHEQKHRRLVEHFLDIKEVLDAEQQERFNEMIRRSFSRHGYGGRGFGGRHGPPKGPGHGRHGSFRGNKACSQPTDQENEL